MREVSWLLKGLNMNVVVSNQAVLEKNSQLLFASPFFPVLLLHSAFFPQEMLLVQGVLRGAQRGSQCRAGGLQLGETRALKSERFRRDGQ